jgi:hypothetical protein
MWARGRGRKKRQVPEAGNGQAFWRQLPRRNIVFSDTSSSRAHHAWPQYGFHVTTTWLLIACAPAGEAELLGEL